MPIQLKGSCHCGAVRFTVDSSTPVPYQVRIIHFVVAGCFKLTAQLCLCSICRKVGGVGGSINLGGHSKTLKVEGKENTRSKNKRIVCCAALIIITVYTRLFSIVTLRRNGLLPQKGIFVLNAHPCSGYTMNHGTFPSSCRLFS